LSHLLLVGPRTDVLGKLFGLPMTVTIVHRPGGDRAIEEAVAARLLDVDFTDVGELLAAVRDVHAWRPIDGILGLTELSLHPVSVVADALGVRANSPATVGYAQDKAAMRRRLAEAGISTTAHRVCESIEDTRLFAARCPDGMILKPVSGNGGTGVSLVRDPGEVAAAWQWATTSRTFAPGAAGPGSAAEPPRVLAEEYLTGREFSVETLSVRGEHQVLAVTGKHTTGAPHFVELGHDVSALVPEAEQTLLAAAAIDALDAIGYSWGPCHTELMLSENGARATVVEINARQGGDQIWELVHLTTGWDMVTASMSVLGDGVLPPDPGRAARGAAVRYLTADPGTVVAIEGVTDALAVEGVLRVGELCKLGHVVSPLGSSWDRLGYVIAVGPDTAAAAAAADRAVACLKIRTEEQAG
jgi:biotin carboxylase